MKENCFSVIPTFEKKLFLSDSPAPENNLPSIEKSPIFYLPY